MDWGVGKLSLRLWQDLPVLASAYFKSNASLGLQLHLAMPPLLIIVFKWRQMSLSVVLVVDLATRWRHVDRRLSAFPITCDIRLEYLDPRNLVLWRAGLTTDELINIWHGPLLHLVPNSLKPLSNKSFYHQSPSPIFKTPSQNGV